MSDPRSIDVRDIAGLARLRLTADEAEEYAGQLGRIVQYVEQLQEVDVTGVEPAARAQDRWDVMRPDEARDGIGVEAALANAPQRAGDQFLVPKVVE